MCVCVILFFGLQRVMNSLIKRSFIFSDTMQLSDTCRKSRDLVSTRQTDVAFI